MSQPTKYLHSSPTEQTVVFAGEFIDITELAREEGFNYTYLSHIFSAKSQKMPSLKTGLLLADALGMSYGDFIEEILRKKAIKAA